MRGETLEISMQSETALVWMRIENGLAMHRDLDALTLGEIILRGLKCLISVRIEICLA
jgi:hypothetical protein